MKVWWCLVHEASLWDLDVCHVWAEEECRNRQHQSRCQMVEMELHPAGTRWALDLIEGGNLDLLYEAWGVIANVAGGDWQWESKEWREAATTWRQKYHDHLDAFAQSKEGE